MGTKFTSKMVVVATVATAIFFSSCMGEKQKQGTVKDLTVDQFSELIQSQDTLILIDVESDQYGDMFIEGAIAYPINNDSAAIMVVQQYGITAPYAVYDITGVKSKKAAQMLANKGATVYNLTPGLMGWIDEDEEIILLPIDSTMIAPMKTTKSKMMADTTIVKMMTNKVNGQMPQPQK